MIDLIDKILEIITFDLHGSHGHDEVVVVAVGLLIWFIIYKVVMYLMGFR
jgi:hypothetical protein